MDHGKSMWIAMGIVAVVAILLAAAFRFGALALLILICPISMLAMMLFMGGHMGHGDHRDHS